MELLKGMEQNGIEQNPRLIVQAFLQWNEKRERKEQFHSTPTNWRAGKREDFPSYCTRLNIVSFYSTPFHQSKHSLKVQLSGPRTSRGLHFYCIIFAFFGCKAFEREMYCFGTLVLVIEFIRVFTNITLAKSLHQIET